MKLNIGAGTVEIEGFTPVDRRVGLEAYPLTYADGSVCEIRASHILEHFSEAEVPKVLADWVRVLEPGGRIIIHEKLLNDDKTGPLAIAAFNVSMLLWTEGQQYSGHELSSMLTEAGFRALEVTPTVGYWSIVTGRKP